MHEKHLHTVLENLGMNSSDTVDGMTADDRQVGHVDPLLAVLLDERHAPQPVEIARILGADLLQVKEVYVINYL